MPFAPDHTSNAYHAFLRRGVTQNGQTYGAPPAKLLLLSGISRALRPCQDALSSLHMPYEKIPNSMFDKVRHYLVKERVAPMSLAKTGMVGY